MRCSNFSTEQYASIYSATVLHRLKRKQLWKLLNEVKKQPCCIQEMSTSDDNKRDGSNPKVEVKRKNGKNGFKKKMLKTGKNRESVV